LFNYTIGENILYGGTEKTTNTEIYEAAKIANALEFIEIDEETSKKYNGLKEAKVSKKRLEKQIHDILNPELKKHSDEEETIFAKLELSLKDNTTYTDGQKSDIMLVKRRYDDLLTSDNPTVAQIRDAKNKMDARRKEEKLEREKQAVPLKKEIVDKIEPEI
jgi:hypothetical protein